MSLKVSIIQSELHWENVDQNLEMFAQKIRAINEPTDVIVLPEMFNTGFSMDSERLAETMEGKTVAWMKAQAEKSGAAIMGSLIIEDTPQSIKENEEVISPLGRTRGVFYNRLIWAQPDGKIFTYNKRHLFRMAVEHNHFSAGEERLIVNYKGWRICLMICYDLRFPVWSRNTPLCHTERSRSVNEGEDKSIYDCLIYVANWPAVRKAPWSKLLEARAIENQCYVVGVNRVGKDGKEIEYSGNSVMVDPKGEVISAIPENENYSETRILSLTELNDFRTKFPVSLDGDEFTL